MLLSHPGCNSQSRSLFESCAERTVAMIAALQRQLLGGNSAFLALSLAVERNEVVDTQAIDVSIIRLALGGKIGTQIGAVGVYGLGQLRKRPEPAGSQSVRLPRLLFFLPPLPPVSATSPRATPQNR